MNEWRPIAILANVQVIEAIGNDKLAVAGISDARIGDCISAQPELKDFLSRFTDAHGIVRKPSVIIAHSSIAKDDLNMDMVAGFRDVISICCILEARQKTLRYGRNAGPIYSNSFSLYPWMLSPHMNRLVAITPAIEAIHRLDKFHGQTSPEIPIHDINAQSSDKGLVSLLLSRWR
ncbi:hypothetical protein [Phyllobacterium sp. SB3]|uniref:hypothetical protein n=1 Tax=Phyllobacterium sp. SB3 TaxID=3156073 RepID=UPI0032AEF2B6